MTYDIQYAHFTVPHSGTRYVNKAVEKAIGKRIYQVSSSASYERTHDREGVDTTFLFCHLGPTWADWAKTIGECDYIKTWITVRSPIHTWGTHAGNYLKNPGDRIMREKLSQIRSQMHSLMEVAPTVGHIHRVEDPIQNLGEYLGLELEPHDQTFSNDSPVKQALRERDDEKLEELCGEFYTTFRDYTTPEIQDFFEDLGYDIWWTNG